MGRVQFSETMTLPSGPGGTLIPIKGIAYVPFTVNVDSSEGPQANAYDGRTGNTPASTLDTDLAGTVNYWLDAGDYNIHVSDPQSPPRIQSFIRGFTAPIIDTNQIVEAAQNLIQFTGDTKYSMQTTDHGLKSDGSYEWLFVTSDADGGGRKLDHTVYAALWALLGSPAPDSNGKFRLPNISGRALIAAGAASGLTVRHLLDLVGEETHNLDTSEMPAHSHGVNDPPHDHDIQRSSAQADSGGLGGVYGLQEGSGTSVSRTEINSTGISIQDAGSGVAHENMQPSFGMNLFVKS